MYFFDLAGKTEEQPTFFSFHFLESRKEKLVKVGKFLNKKNWEIYNFL